MCTLWISGEVYQSIPLNRTALRNNSINIGKILEKEKGNREPSNKKYKMIEKLSAIDLILGSIPVLRHFLLQQ